MVLVAVAKLDFIAKHSEQFWIEIFQQTKQNKNNYKTTAMKSP